MTTIGILGTTHKAAAYKKGRRLPTGTHLMVCIATLCHADTRPRSSVKEATRLVATALSEDWTDKGHIPKTVPNIIKQLEADYDFQKRLGQSVRNGKGDAITKAQKKLA